MVRTKADRVPTKAVGSKAPAKAMKSTPVKKATSNSKGRSYSGGNPECPRPTPEWQKPITCFLNPNPTKKAQENEDEGTSKEDNNESD